MTNQFAPEMQIKQYVTKIRTSTGFCARVFETGDPRYYLLAAVDGNDCDTGFQTPVLKKNLVRDWKKFSVAF